MCIRFICDGAYVGEGSVEGCIEEGVFEVCLRERGSWVLCLGIRGSFVTVCGKRWR